MNRRFEKGRFECIVIYGRRRVGKTALINEFCKDKSTIYFSALNASSRDNLEALSKAIFMYKNPDSTSYPTYNSYYLLRYAKDLPFTISDVGQWWGTDPINRQEVQIDIVGTSTEENAYLIGSCKYRNEKIGVDEWQLLRRYASVFRKKGVFHYYIFSRSGFTQTLQDLEKQGEVKLLTLEDIYEN